MYHIVDCNTFVFRISESKIILKIKRTKKLREQNGRKKRREEKSTETNKFMKIIVSPMISFSHCQKI